MADNVVLNSGSGGVTAATDDVGGVHYQIIKLAFGALDTATLVTGSAGLPVDTELPGAVTLADNAANPAAPAVGAFLMLLDGTTWDRAPGSTTDGMLVNLGTNNDVTVSGTVTANAGTGTFTVGDGGGSLTVDGSVSITGAVDTELPAASALNADNLGAPTVPGIAAYGVYFDGTAWDRMRGDSTDGMLVNLGTNNDVTVTGTVTANAGTGTFLVDTELTAPATLADDMSNPSITQIGAHGMVFDGTTWDRMRGTSVDGVLVNLGTNNDVTVTGTVTANAGSGNFNVVVASALPAGTNNIGDVDVLSLVPGTGATNLGKAEDAAHTTGDVGVLALAVRNDAGGSLADSTGDYIPLTTDSTGALRVVGGGGGTQFAEDAAHTSGDLGTAALGVRRDADTTPVSADGDYHTLLFDANGYLKVNVKAGAAGGVTHTDDALFTAGTDDVVPMAAMFDDTTPDVVDENDAGVLRMSANRNLYVRIRDNAGNERGLNIDASGNANAVINNAAGASAVNIQDGGNSITVDGSVSLAAAIPAGTNNIGDVDVLTLPALPAGTNNIGDVDIASVAAGVSIETLGDVAHDAAASAVNPVLMGAYASAAAPTDVTADTDAVRIWALRNGAQVVNLASGGTLITGDGSNGLDVDVTRVSGNVTVVQATASNLNVQAVGDVAHDAVDSANPQSVGVRAIAHGSNPTAVAAADRSVWYANRHGVPFVIGGHMNAITRRDNFTAAQTDTALVTVAGGLKIVVTRMLVTANDANTAKPSVIIGFGAVNTPTGAGVVAAHPGVPNGVGFSTGDGSGILGIGADGEDLRITCGAPTGGSLDVVTTYYTIES